MCQFSQERIQGRSPRDVGGLVMIRFCSNPECGRGFISLTKPPQDLCPTCRQDMAPLSRLVGGKLREEPKRKKGRA